MLIDNDKLNYKIIELRIDWKAERLPNGTLTKNPDHNLGEDIKRNNISIRIQHLASILSTFYLLYQSQKEFYGETLLKYISDEVIKEWLWIETEQEKESNYKVKFDLEYLIDIFKLENISISDFYNIIIDFQRKYGTEWKNKIYPKHKRTNTIITSFEDEDMISKLHLTFDHLSMILHKLYLIYRTNKTLYGKKFLAFVGNEIVREWPLKDYPFESQQYSKSQKSIFEHWTPISFFRDLYSCKNITQKDFFDALVYYYRIVKISIEENNLLDNNGYKASRPLNAYNELGIQIKSLDKWNSLYYEFDKNHNHCLTQIKSP